MQAVQTNLRSVGDLDLVRLASILREAYENVVDQLTAQSWHCYLGTCGTAARSKAHKVGGIQEEQIKDYLLGKVDTSMDDLGLVPSASSLAGSILAQLYRAKVDSLSLILTGHSGAGKSFTMDNIIKATFRICDLVNGPHADSLSLGRQNGPILSVADFDAAMQLMNLLITARMPSNDDSSRGMMTIILRFAKDRVALLGVSFIVGLFEMGRIASDFASSEFTSNFDIVEALVAQLCHTDDGDKGGRFATFDLDQAALRRSRVAAGDRSDRRLAQFKQFEQAWAQLFPTEDIVEILAPLAAIIHVLGLQYESVCRAIESVHIRASVDDIGLNAVARLWGIKLKALLRAIGTDEESQIVGKTDFARKIRFSAIAMYDRWRKLYMKKITLRTEQGVGKQADGKPTLHSRIVLLVPAGWEDLDVTDSGIANGVDQLVINTVNGALRNYTDRRIAAILSPSPVANQATDDLSSVPSDQLVCKRMADNSLKMFNDGFKPINLDIDPVERVTHFAGEIRYKLDIAAHERNTVIEPLTRNVMWTPAAKTTTQVWGGPGWTVDIEDETEESWQQTGEVAEGLEAVITRCQRTDKVIIVRCIRPFDPAASTVDFDEAEAVGQLTAWGLERVTAMLDNQVHMQEQMTLAEFGVKLTFGYKSLLSQIGGDAGEAIKALVVKHAQQGTKVYRIVGTTIHMASILVKHLDKAVFEHEYQGIRHEEGASTPDKPSEIQIAALREENERLKDELAAMTHKHDEEFRKAARQASRIQSLDTINKSYQARNVKLEALAKANEMTVTGLSIEVAALVHCMTTWLVPNNLGNTMYSVSSVQLRVQDAARPLFSLLTAETPKLDERLDDVLKLVTEEVMVSRCPLLCQIPLAGLYQAVGDMANEKGVNGIHNKMSVLLSIITTSFAKTGPATLYARLSVKKDLMHSSKLLGTVEEWIGMGRVLLSNKAVLVLQPAAEYLFLFYKERYTYTGGEAIWREVIQGLQERALSDDASGDAQGFKDVIMRLETSIRGQQAVSLFMDE